MIKEFILNQLISIHAGDPIAKLKSTFFLAASVSPITFVIDRIVDWTTSNSTYVLFVLAAIIFDHILGTIIHAFIKRDFSFKKNIIGLIVKVGLVIIVGFLFEGINYIVEGENAVKVYLIIVMRLLVFLYPAGSALANSSIITKGKFPPAGFLKRLAKFQENLNPKEFKEKQ